MQVARYTILFLVCYWYVKPTELISAAAITSIVEGIAIAKERAFYIYNSLADDNSITPVDVLVAYAETIPVIGDVLKLINGNTKELDEIKRILISLSNKQEQVIAILLNLQDKLLLIVTRLGISTASSTIKRCNKEKLNFLRNPSGTSEVYRLILCYDIIMEAISIIVGILTEDGSEKIFKETIKANGFCDGLKIEHIYKHLFSYVLMGCETAILSEAIKTNYTSTILLRDCKEYMTGIQGHYQHIFEGCTKDPCETVTNDMKSTVQSVNTSATGSVYNALSYKYPWFKFIVVQSSENPALEVVGNQKPSSATFIIDGNYHTIIWTPFQIQDTPENTSFTFAIEFSTTSLIDLHIGMDVTQQLDSTTAVIVAHQVENIAVSHESCHHLDAIGNGAASPTLFSFAFYIQVLSLGHVLKRF